MVRLSTEEVIFTGIRCFHKIWQNRHVDTLRIRRSDSKLLNTYLGPVVGPQHLASDSCIADLDSRSRKKGSLTAI